MLENTFRAVNIALVNELDEMARDIGLDLRAALQGAATKPFGFMRFDPGPGIGGHCLPIDPVYGRSASNPGQARSTTSFRKARHGSPTPPSTCGCRPCTITACTSASPRSSATRMTARTKPWPSFSMLAGELKKIDPPAFDGYNGFIWAEFLDRWLW